MSGLQCLLVTFASALLLGTVNCQEKPTITYVSQEPILNLRSSVELVCKVQNSQDYPVQWIKLGKTEAEQIFISRGATLLVPDHRYSVKVDPSKSTYTLRINDIRETDEGIYQCQIPVSADNKLIFEVKLKRQLVPPVHMSNTTKSLVVSEGQTVNLECYNDGSPKLEISWRRKNNAELPNGDYIFYGEVLRIDAAKKEHRGVYYCVTKNGAEDRGYRHTVVVEVEFAPVVETKRPRVGQVLQKDADLGCHVIAHPPAAITWHKGQEQLINDQHYRISHFSTDDEDDSIVRISNIKKEDFGDYVCRAVNKLGTAEAKIHLFEIETPTTNSTTPDPEYKASP